MISEFELAHLSDTFFDFDAASSCDPNGAASKLHSFSGCTYDTQTSVDTNPTFMAESMSQHAFQPKEPHMFGFHMPKNDLVQTSSLFASMPSEYPGFMDNWFEPATSTLMDGLTDCLKLVPLSASSDSDLLMSSFPTLAQNSKEEKHMWLSMQPSMNAPSIDLAPSSQPIIAAPVPTYSTSHTVTASMPRSSASPIMMPESSSQRSCRVSTRRMVKSAQRTFPCTSHGAHKASYNGIGDDKDYIADCDYDDDNNGDDDPDYILLENKKRKNSALQAASPKLRSKRMTTCNKNAVKAVNSPSPTTSSSSLSTLSEMSPSSVAVRAGKRLSKRILAASGSPTSPSSPSPSSSPTPSPQRTLAPLPKRKQATTYKQGQRSPCPFEGCNKTFSRDTDVKRHIESVHDSRTLDDILRETRDGLRTCCRWCNKLLARSDACARHEQDACRKNFQSRWCQSRNVFAEGDKPTKKRRVAKGNIAGADMEAAAMSPVPVPAANFTPAGGQKTPATRGTRKSPRRPC